MTDGERGTPPGPAVGAPGAGLADGGDRGAAAAPAAADGSSRRRVLAVAGAVAALVVVAGAAVVARSRSSAAPVAQQVAVPAYIAPAADPAAWARLVSADSRAVGLVVANPASGPGATADPGWRDVLARAHASGKKALGYVDTGYLGRTGRAPRTGPATPDAWRAQIEQDVAHWYEWYPGLVDGIFFDRGDTVCGAGDEVAARYRAIDRTVEQAHPGATTVLNPGTAVPRCYEDAADVLLTFENAVGAYGDATYKGLDWTPADPAKVWHVIYGVPADRVAATVETARARGAGWVYVTDDAAANPYDTLPADPYWDAEVRAVTGNPPRAGVEGG